MCTAVSFLGQYFGRTLDHGCSYGEEVVLAPRGVLGQRFAIGGMAHVADGYPLYYDGMNERGLAMAGLNFVGHTCYRESAGKEAVPQYALLPWVLGRYESVAQAREALAEIQVTEEAFSPDFPAAKLHWMIADRQEAIVVEALEEGLRIYDDPAGVLTNDPPFHEQMFQLNNFLGLSPEMPGNRFSRKLDLRPYSYGMGAMGLPGDLSSQSRFVRAAFTVLNAVEGTPEENLSQFFHILGTVEQVRGCSKLPDGNFETTLYTSCCDLEQGIYYYTTYGNRQLTGVRLQKEGETLKRFPLVRGEQVRWQWE